MGEKGQKICMYAAVYTLQKRDSRETEAPLAQLVARFNTEIVKKRRRMR